MKIQVIDDPHGITDVIMVGRMDIAGVGIAEPNFNAVAASRKKVIVDFSGVDFLASLGMRTLVMTAKAVSRKGGKLVILSPQPNVEKALRTAGLDTIIPIVVDRDAATSHFS
jgi:anti-sigma B factor antagonist